MQSTLAELELAIIPPTLDQVLVGSIERTRTNNPRAVLLLGMNAGTFPRAMLEKSVLNDRDRQSLHAAHVEVEPPSRQAMLEERFLGYLALTRASERLLLLRVGSDHTGNELEPSPFWRQVEHAVRDLSPMSVTRTIDKIATPRQVVSHVLTWIRQQKQSIARDDAAALYDWLANSPSEPVAVVRDRAWPVLKYRNAPKLSKTVSLRLFKSPLESSVSRFESFAACPFQHFARYGLRLQPPPERDITALDLGSQYHSVLERLIRKTIDANVDFATAKDLTPEQIREIAKVVAEQLRNQVFLSNARNRYTLERLEQVV
jgi:ATP-dependent helicase/nuclease subunit B